MVKNQIGTKIENKVENGGIQGFIGALDAQGNPKRLNWSRRSQGMR